TAAMIAQSLGFRVKAPKAKERGPGSLVISSDDEDQDLLEPRNPVVTILGHVDHGKTTLLDSIRNTNVVDGEAGGITQHIGAYQVKRNGQVLTFLDTPGHEAFTAMRASGAQVTDIAVLVVAADDGIMPQTVEAIDHVKAAGVPIVVAINKIDRPNADPERVKRQLAEHDLLVEDWGGDVISVALSALTGEGVQDLLDNLQVVAEMGDLKANPSRPARGVVVEAQIDKSKGPIATVLVQTGTLRLGDNLVAGVAKGKVRAMLNDRGERITEAGPSLPVEVLGLGELPDAGDIFEIVPDERTARSMVEERLRERQDRRGAGVTLEEIHSRMESGEAKSLDLIVKTDVQGSVDAVRSVLTPLSTDETRVNIIHAASGSITESDVLLAVASDAIIVGFNALPEPGADSLARQEGVEIRHYDVIYNLVDDIDAAIKGMLTPKTRDIVEGVATVRAVFKVGRRGAVAGVGVSDGKIARSSLVRLSRAGELVFEGQLSSLRRFKDNVREVAAGFECGVGLEGFVDFKEGDLLEAFHIEIR
ncbi:MAG: translation initiation factor IF-2, partial [Chloroflexi bacterium]|nr:translation initiation factor IF-2 [Chloroflexota bacterium]